MTTQYDKASHFHSLHRSGDPLVLFNIWDAGSAKTVADAGASALATGSWSVAAANGFPDGERVPSALVFDNLARITGACAVPVTVDLERGYDDVDDTVRRAISAGAVGCNLEDGTAQGLRDADANATRLAQARAVADAVGVPIFINARTDIFLQTPAHLHGAQHVDEALLRCERYAAAGANGLFVPGLVDQSLIARVVRESRLPVNVMVGANMPSLRTLAALGVARVSHGHGPYILAMQALAQASRAACELA